MSRIHKVGQLYGGKAVIGIWDWENNNLPTRCSVKSAVLSIHMAMHARGIRRPLELYAVGNSMIPETPKGRRELGFYVNGFFPTSFEKQAADFRARGMIRSWSAKNPAGEYLALLASDGDYEKEAALLEARGQHLLNSPLSLLEVNSSLCFISCYR